MEIKKQYRPEIEGIRVIAALLVAIYHIWMARVSGGVDVFFVVSGFLITTSLLSRYARDGYIKFGSFILNLFKRLLPHAFIVLAFTIIASYFILPEVRYLETIREIIASIFYFENWQLAITGTDYLGQNNEQSPVQHFWAMSIQGQFYIIWFLIISFAIWIFSRTKYELKNVFLTILLILFILSFTYSIYMTNQNQPWAYFDTSARLWEFAMGGMLMVFIFRIKLPNFLSFLLGWVGLLALSTTGLIFDVGSNFPGYIALIPVLAAFFMLLAGQNPTYFGVEKILGSKPMIWLGGLSYGIYLWHWPLLIFYYEIFDTIQVGLFPGALIILVSIFLSYLVKIWIENPLNNSFKSGKSALKVFSPVLVFLSFLLILVGVWYLSITQEESGIVIEGNSDYPGALVSIEEYSNPPFLDPIPSLTNLPEDIADGCMVKAGNSKVELCEFGETENYEHIVTLVGGSKSAHWLPSLKAFAEDEAIKLISVTKSGCRFTTDKDVKEDCYEWNQNVVQSIAETETDLVVAMADINQEKEENIPKGYIEQFNRLNEYDIDILALRDSPTFSEKIPECLSANDLDSSACGVPKTDLYGELSGWDKLENPPANVTYADYTDFFCPDGFCSPIIGNIIVYRDHHHLSATFAETLGPILQEDVMKVLNNNLSERKEKSKKETENQDDNELSESSEDNLININELVEGKWIDTKGVQQDNSTMYQTQAIEYSSSNQYSVNANSYVSYYRGEDFIKTIRYSGGVGDLPHILDDVEEADNIVLSFSEQWTEDIKLIIEKN